MKPNKTNANKVLRILEKTNKKVFTCENLSREMGLDQETIFDFIENFYAMIRLDPSHNLKDLIPDFTKYIEKEETKLAKENIKKEKRISHSEYTEYKDFIDYISRVMTTGGMLDTGYKITPKDKKILMRLLKKECSKKN